MTLTNGQEEGLKVAVERYKSKKPYTTIVGYAGTGKTTLVKFIVDELKLNDMLVVYIAYTGKAALVLRNKGCANAMTAHRLLYKSEEQPDGTFIHTPKKKLDKHYSLIVCDE